MYKLLIYLEKLLRKFYFIFMGPELQDYDCRSHLDWILLIVYNTTWICQSTTDWSHNSKHMSQIPWFTHSPILSFLSQKRLIIWIIVIWKKNYRLFMRQELLTFEWNDKLGFIHVNKLSKNMESAAYQIVKLGNQEPNQNKSWLDEFYSWVWLVTASQSRSVA